MSFQAVDQALAGDAATIILVVSALDADPVADTALLSSLLATGDAIAPADGNGSGATVATLEVERGGGVVVKRDPFP